ncbi:MAG: hypothetical protein E4G98_03565 [Promethearchaeota archaeon]|nr:MAG: hypothetical protein E4G98_03565 [Candidatus Lokiarchaeota archaeon]
MEMSEYPHLKPVFASSTMSISRKGHFQEIITYDYEDFGANHPNVNPTHSRSLAKNYYHFLQNSDQYNREITMYWNNLQDELDEEINRVNGKEVHLRIIHCNIHFRTYQTPFVQWIIEFSAPLIKGLNTYENVIEPVTLDYPIYSVYILAKGLRVTNVSTTLDYTLNPSKRIIEYYGDEGDNLGDFEQISFSLEKILEPTTRITAK